MLPSSELNLLIVSCRLYLKTSTIEDWKAAIQNPNLNWGRIWELASWHQTRPILFEALLLYKPETVPDEIFEQLGLFCRQLAIENLSRLSQLRELTDHFESQHIQLVLHKGVHYASFYKSLAHREFGDIDVFVREEQLEEAIKTMVRLGWQSYIKYEDVSKIDVATLMKLDHHIPFCNPQSGLMVEIHWRSHLTGINIELNPAKKSINGIDVFLPTNQSYLSLLTSHHAGSECWGKLKYLMDLAIIDKAEGLTGIAKAQLVETGLLADFEAGRKLCSMFFDYENIAPNKTMVDWHSNAEIVLDGNESVKMRLKRVNEPILSKLIRSIMKFRLLSTNSKLNLVRSIFGVMAIKIGLTILPHQTFRRVYGYLIKVKSQKTFTNESFNNAAWAIRVVSARWPWNATCLPQALTFKYLHRQDPRLNLKIGVNKNTIGQFQAHAWVEKNGQILIGETAENFVPLWEWEQPV